MNIKIPIFLASDNEYTPYLYTTIFSIIKNTKSYINFYVLDGGISDKNKKKIANIKKKYNSFSIEFISMNEFNLDRFPNLKHYSLNTFSRYFIPEIKPNLDKILYLDVDIIVKGDILELYNQELENYPIGAVLEDFYSINYTKLKQICPEYKGGSNYFNAGVLLLNLKYFRENNTTQILIDKTIELKDALNCPDQDVFNIVFENNFKILDYKYNFMPDHKNYINKLGKAEAINAIDNHIIIHYTGRKPWENFKAENANDFWEIAKEGPFFYSLMLNIPILQIKEIPRRLENFLKKTVKKIFF